VHKTQRHVLPTLGRKRLRRLRPEDLERLYESMLHPTDGTRPLSAKTVYEVHLIIRGALDHAVRRGLVNRNVALAASAPKLRAIPKIEQKAWTADQLAASYAPPPVPGSSPRWGCRPTPVSVAPSCSV